MKNVKIYIILICVMLVWGFNVSALKILVESLPPVTVTALRVMTAGLFVVLILSFMKLLRLPTKKEIIYIIFGSLLNIVFHHFFLAIGLRQTSAANGGLILGLGPLLTAFLAMAILRQLPSFLRILGFLLGAIGVFFTVLTGGEGLSGMSSGDGFVFLSIFSQALSFILISKAAKTLDPRLLTGYMMVIGSILLFFISLRVEPGALNAFNDISVGIYVAFFSSAILATAVGHMIYNYAIGKVGAAESAIFLNLNTFFSLVGAAVLLGEPLLVSHFLGLIFIVSGVFFGSGAMEELIRKRKGRVTAG